MHRPKVAIDWAKLSLLCSLRGEKMRYMATNRGRYTSAHVETAGRWAEQLGVDLVELVDVEFYWRVYGCPLHLAKLAAHEAGLSCVQARRLERHVRVLWQLMSEMGIDGREFLVRGSRPTGQEEYGRRARMLVEWLVSSGAGEVTFEVLFTLLNGLKRAPGELGRLLAEVVGGAEEAGEAEHSSARDSAGGD